MRVQITCKFDVELVLRLEDLDVQGAVWSEVFHRPGPQDGLVVLWGSGGSPEIQHELLLVEPSHSRKRANDANTLTFFD